MIVILAILIIRGHLHQRSSRSIKRNSWAIWFKVSIGFARLDAWTAQIGQYSDGRENTADALGMATAFTAKVVRLRTSRAIVSQQLEMPGTGALGRMSALFPLPLLHGWAEDPSPLTIGPRRPGCAYYSH